MSAGRGMTKVVLMSEGRNAIIEQPILILKNKDSPYSIRGVADTVPGAAYIIEPKRWMDSEVMSQLLGKRRIISKLS